MGQGAAAAPAAAPAPAAGPHDWISDKFRVAGDDGAVNIEASARKMAEAYGNLEKRFGSGDVPPADVSGYKITVPEAHAEVLAGWDPAADQALQGFLAKGHKLGMTQPLADLVVGEYGRVMAEVKGMQTSPDMQADQTAAALREVWKDDAEFDRNVGLSYQAGTKLAAKLGVEFDEFNAALGNNPMFLRLAAALAPEMQEDTPQGTQAGDQPVGDFKAQVATLNAEKAALPEKDPRREQIQQRLNALYAKQYPGQA